jgi:hypothetical protein
MKTAFAAAVLVGLVAFAPSAYAQTGACCKVDNSCRIQTEANCTTQGGQWFGAGSQCVTTICVPTTTSTSTTTTTLETTTTTSSSTTSTTAPKPAAGCTPGYWKQDHHFDSWVGYAPGDSFESVFGRDVPGNPTLVAALAAGGGGLRALMRHTVAALLNAAHPNVDPAAPFDTTAEVIAAFQAAFDSGDYETTKNLFAASNEAGRCPLN